MRLLITHNKKWIGNTVQVETRQMRKKFPSVFTMARNCSSEALLSVLSNGETLNHHGEQMVDKTFIWLIENVLSEFCPSSIRSGLKYLLSLGFVSFSSFYMPQEMLKVVHPNQITQEKFIIECPKKNIADVLLRRCIKKEKLPVFQVDLCPPSPDQIKL